MGWLIKELQFDFWWVQKMFLFFIASRMTLGLTKPPSYIMGTRGCFLRRTVTGVL
jgi:hypothetical protein